MNNIYNSNEIATVCTDNSCITVYGTAAKIVSFIVVLTVAILAILLILKYYK